MIRDRDVFFLKTSDARREECTGAESEQASSQQPSLLAPYGINKPLQLHVECVINSSPSGYTFKMNDARDVKKGDEFLLISDFDISGFYSLGMHYKLFSCFWYSFLLEAK
jgi:hypothetical protein